MRLMARIVEDAILIYTDGSLYPAGRTGGYSIVFVHVNAVGEERIVEEHSPPGVRGTTGNRMELQACIDGLEKVSELECFHTVNRVVLRTDSRYVADHYRNAFGNWVRQKWRNQQGRPIENADLWKILVRAYRKIHKRVEFEWIKGHGKGRAKDQYNVLADKLAKASAKNPLSRSVFRSSVRRKTSSKYTQRGSVKMLGQTMTIRVIEVQWMPVQRIWKYRYEVTSKDSPYCGNLDWVFSSEQMRDGHCYEVRVNENTASPEILEVIREVDQTETQ